MPELSELLKDVRKRRSRTGLITADRYFRQVENCFDGGFCPVKVAGAKSEDQWRKALKEAEQKLTYSTRRTRVLQKSIKASKSEDFIAEFDCIVTTPRRDRDRDVLETKGAKIDPNLPLLMQHMGMMPIGKRLKTLRKDDKELRFKAGIADCELGRDNLGLVKAGVLRISHGFTPIEYEPMPDEDGWHFKRFEIYEFSLVSIPSNVDAVVTSFSEKDFQTDLMRGWYGAQREKLGKRKSSVATVPADIKASETSADDTKLCQCKGETHDEDEEQWRQKYTAWLSEDETRQWGDKPEWEKGAVRKMDDGLSYIPEDSHYRIVSTYQKELQDSAAEPAPRTLADIEREYLAELAVSDTDAVRKSHRILSLMLRSREEQAEAKAWDDFLSQFTTPAMSGS